MERLYAFFAAMLNRRPQEPAPLWRTVNVDPDLNDPLVWRWADKMRSGYAYTRLERSAGVGAWAAAAIGQKFAPVPLSKPQKVSFRVLPYYEDVSADALFHLYVEFWVRFSEPMGPDQLTGAELMLIQRAVSSPNIQQIAEGTHYHHVHRDPGGAWYYIVYRAPDVPFAEWSTCTFDLSKLLIPKLGEIYGCDPGKAFADELHFGVEGFAVKGEVEACWDHIAYQVADERR